MSYSSASLFAPPPSEASFVSHPAPPPANAAVPAAANAAAAPRWHPSSTPMGSTPWGYPLPPGNPDPALAPPSQPTPPATAVPPTEGSFASSTFNSPALSSSATINGVVPASPHDVRATPLTPMAGTEGSRLAIRVTLPFNALDHMSAQQDSWQFHIVFGSFLVVPHVTLQPPHAGKASVVLTTNVPVLTDLPGVNPDNIAIRIQVRLAGSRAPTLYNVGAYRMLPKNPPHVRPPEAHPPSPSMWNMPQQPKAEPQYGPVRTQSIARRDVGWEPGNPYMRGRHSDQGIIRAPSPARGIAPRLSHPMMGGGMTPTFSAPPLVRAPQVNQPHEFAVQPMSNRPRAQLKLQGDLGSMAYGWSVEELQEGRRLVQFWRKQEGITIYATFRPIMPDQYVKNSIVVSCIFRADRNECYITSVDAILLLEALVACRFSIEEKNRIRRNLEGFHPETVHKHSGGSEDFFRRIMNFKDPKPRTIAKDVKTFSWKVLEHALCKVIEKYVGDVPLGAQGGGELPTPGMDAHPVGLPPARPSPAEQSMHFVPPPGPAHAPHTLPSHGMGHPTPAGHFMGTHSAASTPVLQ